MKALQKLRIFVFILMIACLVACLTACEIKISLGSMSGSQSGMQEPSISITSDTFGDSSISSPLVSDYNSTSQQVVPIANIVNLSEAPELDSYANSGNEVFYNPIVIGEFKFLDNNEVCQIIAPKNSEDGLYAFTKFIRLRKDANASYGVKSCQFYSTGSQTLVVYCNRSSPTATAPALNLVTEYGTIVESKPLPNDGRMAYCVTFNITDAGNYAICGSGTGVNVFALGLVKGQQGNPPTPKPEPIVPPIAPTELVNLSEAPEMAAYVNDMGDTLSDPVVIGGFTFLDRNKAYHKNPKTSQDGLYTFTKYIQLGKDVNASYGIKSCQFYSTGSQTLTVYCNRSSSTAVSPALNLFNEEGLIVESKPIPNDGNKAYLVTFNITEAGNYAICGSYDTGVKVFAIGLS